MAERWNGGTETERPPEGFGRRMYDARRKSGKTLNSVHTETGISYSHLWECEVGNREPKSIDRVEKIADCLGVRRGWLLWGEE